MKEALSLPDAQLEQTITDYFDIRVRQLDFIPIGESSWLYRTAASNNQPLAVKVQAENNPAVDEARRILEEHDFPYVPKLHLTKEGTVQAQMGDLYVSVEEYIEHDEVKAHDATPGQEYLYTVGKALRSLHSINRNSDNDSKIPAETFQSAFLPLAKNSIANFRDQSAIKPELQAITSVLNDKASSIEALFQRSTGLGSELLAQALPLVLTHGDVHFGNTLETKDGNFYIVDWDSTMIARPGHDLMYFSDAQLADISKGYGSDLLSNPVELAYYRNHLMLRFMWFWVNKAIHAQTDNELAAITETITTTLDESPYLLRALGLSERT